MKSDEVTTEVYLTHHCTVQTFFTCCRMTILLHVLSHSSMHALLGTDFINTLTHAHTQTWALIFNVIASSVDAVSVVGSCASNPSAKKSVSSIWSQSCQVWTVLWMLQHLPSVAFEPLFSHLRCADCYVVMKVDGRRLNHPCIFLQTFSLSPVCCSKELHWFSHP